MTAAVQTSLRLAQRFENEFPTSRKLYDQARSVFPDGVTHDARALQPFPIYIERAEGAYKWDVDGHQLLDFWSGHGSILLGHSHPAVVEAVQRQMSKATHPGACHEKEIEWGQWVQRLIPSAERVRFVASGTEATMMALRLSRIFTGKRKVLKFVGHFHGWNDFLIPEAYAPYQGAPVPGVPPEVAADTVVIPPNNPELVEQTLQQDPEIACVILEPTGGHWGSVPVGGAFLQALREITTRQQRVLIFDEVISGFRVSPGGAQAHFGVTPDLTTLAKILAGGLPGGCVAGKAEILAAIEVRPGKPKMRHPGTFNANPLSAAAGIATLERVATGEPNRHANQIAATIRRELNELFRRRGANWVAYGAFSGFRLLSHYNGPRPENDTFIPYNGDPHRLEAIHDPRLHHAFRAAMLLHGVDLSGLGGMTTAAHTENDVRHTVEAVSGTLDVLRAEGLIDF